MPTLNPLLQKKCKPCEGGVPTLTPEEVQRELSRLNPDWKVVGNKIARSFTFKNFAEAMKFVNRVAELAEEEGHHPDLQIHYNKVEVELSTHAIGGLSENDFIVAAKMDDKQK